MNIRVIRSAIVLSAALFCLHSLAGEIPASSLEEEVLAVEGLNAPVTIIKDRWGIAHIYAENQKDLFFAQGYHVARDRLFQLEIWRRQATGTLAEMVGPRAVKRDIGARLFKARVNMKEEMSHYHPDGEEIITSFVRGINAYIDHVNRIPNRLPLEFRLLGIRPGHWTPEVVVSRHNGLFRNALTEVAMARAVDIMGAERVKEILNLEPGAPSLKPADGLDISLIPDDVLELYAASRSPVEFLPGDIVLPEFRANSLSDGRGIPAGRPPETDIVFESNNWVISGRHTFSGFPFMANDPHRRHQIPSLRYWVHLNAPGWNVIGGGEPCLPGVSIGHNDFGAWGLTIFSTDQEDVYVYDTNPSDHLQYKYNGKWETMEVIREKIPVEGQAPVAAELKFTRHGPVLCEDRENGKVYALRAGWLEIGGSPYLASLRMDQAKSWKEFRRACSFSNTPSENMVWADSAGNIGWQAVGITPLRHGWSGLLPVPGDGRFEWKGYLPIMDLPHILNPEEGFLATANQNNIPAGYPHTIGFLWSDPFRYSRIAEVLGSGRRFAMADMMELQYDFLSVPARMLVPLLKGSPSTDKRTEKARRLLLSWNFVMDPDSVEAAVFQSWERRLSENVWRLFIPEEAEGAFPFKSLEKMIGFLTAPDGRFGPDPIAARDAILLESLEQAVDDITGRLGPDMEKWHYGQKKFHHILIEHLLSGCVNENLRQKLNVGPEPQGGNSYTVNNTAGTYNQIAGASFRLIADLENWDRSLGTNAPGQSGDPESPHYADLFRLWAQRKYFAVLYSRDKILSAAEKIISLEPPE